MKIWLEKIIALFSDNRGRFVGANVFGNLIPLFVAPILTRLYSPEDFGHYAIYFLSVSILGSVGSLSLQNAIFLPDNDASAVDLCITSIITGGLICTLFSLLILINGNYLADLFLGQEILKNIYVLIGSLYFVTCYACLYSLALKKGIYSVLTRNKIILSVTLALVQIAIGLTSGSGQGLMLANLIGVILSVVLIVPSVWKELKESTIRYNIQTLYLHLRKNLNFIIYTAPATLVNSLSSSGPEIVIKLVFGAGAVGHYSLANRMLSAPLNFVSGAIQDIFKERAASEGKLTGNYINTFNVFFSLMLLVSILLVVPIAIFAPTIFKFVFGLQWEESGYITQSLSLLVIIRFVSSPLSYIWILRKRQKEDFIWQIGLLIITFLSLGFSYFTKSDLGLRDVVLLYSVSAGLWYFLCLWLSSKYAR